MMRSRSLLPAIAFMMLLPSREAAAQNQAPPNDPAALRLEGGSIQLRYQGTLIFDGRIKNPEGLRTAVPNVVRKEDTVDQVIVFYARGRDPLEITGTVAASNEAFPCESDRAVRARPIVRHSSGLSRSLLRIRHTAARGAPRRNREDRMPPGRHPRTHLARPLPKVTEMHRWPIMNPAFRNYTNGVRCLLGLITRRWVLGGPRSFTLILSSECNGHCVMCWDHSPHLEPAREMSGCRKCSMAKFNLNVYRLLRLNSMRYDEA